MHEQRVDELKEESIPQLLRQLTAETTTLVRQEIDLAKVELSEKTKTISASAGMFGAAAIFALGAFGAVTAAIISVLALILPLWAAALVVAILYAIVALVAALRGRKQLVAAAPFMPQQTAQSVKEDVEWVKTQVQSSRK